MHGLTLGAGVGGHAAAGAGGPPPGTQFVGAGPLGYPTGMCVIGAGAGYASLPNIEAQVIISTISMVDLYLTFKYCSRTLDLHLQLPPLMRARLVSQSEDSLTSEWQPLSSIS